MPQIRRLTSPHPDRPVALAGSAELDAAGAEIEDARGEQLAEIAMNWSRQKPFVDTSIFGAQKRSRIESNAKCMDWELTAEEMLTLDEAIAEILK